MIKRFSVQKLNRFSRHYEIWCIGCGKRFTDIINLYEKEAFVQKISVLMDSNHRLWGTFRKIGEREINICNPQIIKEKGNSNILLIITSDFYRDIIKIIGKDIKNKKILGCIYPIYYHALAERIMSVCSCFPIKRQLLFYAGSEPHENADAVVEYLTKEYKGKKYKIIYLTDQEKEYVEGITFLNKNLLCCKSSIWQVWYFCWLYARSAYLFYEDTPLKKVNSKQKLIYLNHGTIPLKKVSDVLKQPEEVDYAICPSENCADFYRVQYGISIEKLFYLMPPRVQFILQKKKVLHNFIDIEKKQVIIWLPTFRQLSGTERSDSIEENPFYLLAGKNDYRKIEEILKENNQILLLKPHPREKNSFKVPDFCNNILLLSEKNLKKNGLTLQSILGETHALITDYSGIAFEYILLERPICYIVGDMEQYFRGFSVEQPFDYMPGQRVQTLEEMIQFLKEVRLGIDRYQEERHILINRLFGKYAYQNGAETLIKEMDKQFQHHSRIRIDRR